jgi:hypothetical protein
MINFNLSQKNLHPVNPQARCVFPCAGSREFRLEEIAIVQDETPKEGYHDQAGVILMRGAGIRRGVRIDTCSNLDFAPTILHLLGIPAPSHMRGRVLVEALENPPHEAPPREIVPREATPRKLEHAEALA